MSYLLEKMGKIQEAFDMMLKVLMMFRCMRGVNEVIALSLACSCVPFHMGCVTPGNNYVMYLVGWLGPQQILVLFAQMFGDFHAIWK